MRPRAWRRAVILAVFGATLSAAAPAASRPSPPSGTSPSPPSGTSPPPPSGTSPSPASGTSPPPPSPSPAPQAIRDDVRRLHNEALAAFKRGELLVAYEGFVKAWSQQRIPRIAGNLGRTELRLGKHRDAAEHLAVFLREGGDLGDDERREVERLLGEARARVGALRVEVTPPGAEVLVDGAPIGTAPIADELYVDPGPHTVEARSRGVSERRSITARAGAGEPLRLDVPPPPEVAPPSLPVAKPFPVWAVVFAGGAAVAVTGGVLIGVGVAHRSDALSLVPKDAAGHPLCATAGSGQPDRTSSGACDDVRAHAASADTLGNTGVALAAGGGALAAGALIAWWLWPPGKDTNTAVRSTLVPVAGPSGAALVWRGSF